MINLLVGGVAGAVLLAFVGAPQSLGMVALVGPDSPDAIGPQLATALAGAVATAVAVLVSRHWRWLVAGGALAVLVGVVLHDPSPALLTVEIAPADPRPPLDPVVTAFVMAASGVLLIGLLGLAGELLRTSRLGAATAGLVGVAGYFGVALVGRLLTAEPAVRIAVAVVAAALTVLTVLTARPDTAPDGGPAAPDTAPDGGPGAPDTRPVEPGGTPVAGSRARLLAAGAVLLAVLPTVLVAITGEVAFGTLAGGVAGLVVLGGALAAASPAGARATLAVAATGAVLAAPVVLLVVIRDSVAGQVWYGWPLALAGVLCGAALAGRLPANAPALAAAAVMIALVVTHRPPEALVWVYLVLVMAAVAATVGTAARQHGDLPAFGALATAAAVGVHASLHLARMSADGNADPAKVLGPSGQVASAVVLAVAAVVLLLLSGRRRARPR